MLKMKKLVLDANWDCRNCVSFLPDRQKLIVLQGNQLVQLKSLNAMLSKEVRRRAEVQKGSPFYRRIFDERRESKYFKVYTVNCSQMVISQLVVLAILLSSQDFQNGTIFNTFVNLMPPHLRDHHFSKCVDGRIGNKEITKQSEIMDFLFPSTVQLCSYSCVNLIKFTGDVVLADLTMIGLRWYWLKVKAPPLAKVKRIVREVGC